MRRAVVALLVTAVAVVWLVRYETRPPRNLNPNSALHDRDTPRVVARAAPARTAEPPRRSGTTAGPGTRSASGPLITTPFSVIQVRATIADGRLVGVETLSLSGDDAHTNRLNRRAEPILREEALAAGSADIDVVTGATYTSESWIDSLQAAIAAARRG